MTFKEKIVKLRKLKGLTQDEFASAVGVSRQAVYKWESGQSYPEVAKLLEIKILFNISIDDLLDENYEVVVPEKKKKRVPKEVKKEIENAVFAPAEPAVEESIPVEEPTPAVVEESVAVAAPAVEETVAAPIEAPAPVEEPAPVAVEEPAREEKKVGFFGRLFGRK